MPSIDLKDPFFTEHGSFVIAFLILVIGLLWQRLVKQHKETKELKSASFSEIVKSLNAAILAQKEYFETQNENLAGAIDKLTENVESLTTSIAALAKESFSQIAHIDARLSALQSAHDVITRRRKLD